jgi:hypothetical protein
LGDEVEGVDGVADEFEGFVNFENLLVIPVIDLVLEPGDSGSRRGG